MAVPLAQLEVEVGADTSRARQGLRELDGHVRQADGMMKNAVGTMLGFAAGEAVFMGLAAVGQFASQAMIGFNSTMEQAKIGFTTMLGSGQEAQTFLDELADFAEKTPFEFPDLVKASQKLLAMGFAAKDVRPMLTNIGDAVAGLGGGAFEIDRVTIALGQLQAKGKVSAEEMMQLTEVGIPAWEILSEGIGKTTAETMKLSEKGLIPADKAIKIILAGMEERFGGLMAAQSKSFAGAMSTVKDAATQAIAKGTEPLFKSLSALALKLAGGLSAESFQAGAEKVGQSLANFITWIGRAVDNVDAFLDRNEMVRDILLQVGKVLAGGAAIGGFIKFGFVMAGLISTLGTWIVRLSGIPTILALVSNPVGLVIVALAALAAGVIYAYQHFEGFRQVVGRVIAWVQTNVGPVIEQAMTALVTRFQWAVGWVQTNWPAIQEAVGHVLNFLEGKIKMWVAIFRFLWHAWGDDLVSLAKRVWTTISGVVAGAIKVIEGTVRLVLAIINGDWSAAWNAIVAIARGVWQIITSVIRGAAGIVGSIIGGLLSTVRGLWDGAWKAMGTLLRGAWNDFVKTVREERDIMLGFVRAIPGRIQGFLRALPGWFKELAKDMFNGLVDGWRSIDIGKTLSKIIGDAVNWVKRNILKIKSPSQVFYDMGRMSMLGFLRGIKDNASNIFEPFISKIDPSILGKALQGVTAFPKWLMDKLGGAFGKIFGGGGPVSGSLAGWTRAAMAVTGVPASWFGPLVARAKFESGGNPRAVNLWDVNARRGTPSKGLMQTIGPTFNAYKMPGLSNIFNPVHNMVAAIRYIQARYGSIFSIHPPVRGYARGGMIDEHVVGVGLTSGRGYEFGEAGPEMVVPGRPRSSSASVNVAAGAFNLTIVAPNGHTITPVDVETIVANAFEEFSTQVMRGRRS